MSVWYHLLLKFSGNQKTIKAVKNIMNQIKCEVYIRSHDSYFNVLIDRQNIPIEEKGLRLIEFSHHEKDYFIYGIGNSRYLAKIPDAFDFLIYINVTNGKINQEIEIDGNKQNIESLYEIKNASKDNLKPFYFIRTNDRYRTEKYSDAPGFEYTDNCRKKGLFIAEEIEFDPNIHLSSNKKFFGFIKREPVNFSLPNSYTLIIKSNENLFLNKEKD